MALAVVQTRQAPIVRVRRETPERWQAALKRAIAQGIEVFIAEDDGERFVTSASKLDTVHRTDGYSCTCEAALSGDPVCQHRAALKYVMGWLKVEDDPEPEPTAPVRPIRPAPKPSETERQWPNRPCSWCYGTGRTEGYYRDYVPCVICDGTGVKPAYLPEQAAA